MYGRWKDGPHRLRYLRTPAQSVAARYSFAISSPASRPRPQLPAQPHITGWMLEDRPAAQWAAQLPRVPDAVRPAYLRVRMTNASRRPACHFASTAFSHPEHNGYVLPVPPRHHSGHCPQPKDLPNGRRQMPRVPCQIAHTPPTTQNRNRFRINRESVV